MPAAVPAAVPECIFWFGVVGAGAAALKHLLNTEGSLKELTPVALRGDKGKPKLSPEAQFWGGYAFSALNAGYCTIGLYAGLTNSAETKAAYLLGTGVMFELFSLTWALQGHTTGKPDYKAQCVKIGVLGGLFLGGFALQLLVNHHK